MYNCRNEAREARRMAEFGCLRLVATIFGALFLFALGLIIGAAIAATIAANLVAFIVLTVILFVLTAVTLIYMCCRFRRTCRCDD